MIETRTMSQNEAAFRHMKSSIDARFSPGHWVAFDDGRLIADAPTFDDLSGKLAAMGKDRPDIFVAQAGVDYPEFVWIL